MEFDKLLQTGGYEPVKHVDTPRLTIQRTGNFYLNRAADNALGPVERVAVYFSSKDRSLAFVPLRSHHDERKHADHSWRVNRAAYKTLIAGQKITHEHNIPLDETLHYDLAIKDGPNGKYLVAHNIA